MHEVQRLLCLTRTLHMFRVRSGIIVYSTFSSYAHTHDISIHCIRLLCLTRTLYMFRVRSGTIVCSTFSSYAIHCKYIHVQYMYMHVSSLTCCECVQVYRCSVDEMVEDLEKGDVAETARWFFLESTHIPPCATSTLTLGQVRTYIQ